MNLPLFLARRIYGDEGNREKASQEIASEKTRSVSRPAIRIATIGVAIGLAVMIVTVSVILGFKHTIRDKVVGFGSHIQVMNVHSMAMTAGSRSVCIGDSMLQAFCDVEGVRHAARIVMTQGILKTEDDFLGVMMKGIGPEYDTQFLNECLLEGELPAFCDTATTYPLVISKTMADKLRLKVGDRVCTIGGIYGTITNIRDENTVTLAIGPQDVPVVFARWAIRNVEEITVENDSEVLA